MDRVETQAATDPSLAEGDMRHDDDEVEPQHSINGVCKVLLSVSWTFPAELAVSQGQPDYLDGSCLVYAEERLLDVVDFRGAHSAAVGCHSQKSSSATFEWSAGRGQGAAVLHSGDVMTGEGGRHVIRVNLASLPASATDCFFAISAYNCRNLSKFRTLDVRLSNADSPTRTLARVSTADIPPKSSAILVCGMRRRLDTWHVCGLCRPCDATVRDYAPIEALVRPMQDTHVLWRRRRPWVLLPALCYFGRASLLPRALEKADEPVHDIIVLLFKLPTILFQCIVQFL